MQVLPSLSALPASAAFDLVVVGAGGAGMATALFAALAGQRVLLVERTAHVGGTTAWSGGTTWIPGTRHAASVNPGDTLANAKHYLDNAVGERSPAALRQAFLDHGAQAVEQLETHTQVHYRAYPRHPDYLSALGGSTVNGRALEPLPFDGRLLGPLFALVRPPIPEFTVLGGMMVDRTDINHLLALGTSLRSFRHACKLLARHATDRLRHPRGTRLVMGNALVGRLLHSLAQHPQVTLALNTTLQHIARGADGIQSVTLADNGTPGGQQRTVAVGQGLVLASGGFNRHPQLRQDLLPGVPLAQCPAAPGHTGVAHGLAQQLGAHYGTGGLSPAFWAPVSKRQRPDGSSAVFPHFMMDRAKPGMLAVNAAGQRFVDESTSYHLFALALQQPGNQPAWLVGDATALRTYGMGMVRPGGKGLEPFMADGYLARADTLDALARQLGISPTGLQASVARINAYAATGVDPDFQRGTGAYSQNMGDPAAGGKNPNLGPLTQAPYYAVRLYPGDIGAATGFATDGNARVLGEDHTPIPGLYAVGNDMHSIMGGVYTAPGITLGPGVVFAYLAARHAASLQKK